MQKYGFQSTIPPFLVRTLLITLLAASAAFAQRGDNIVFQDGKTERGEILQVTPEKITVMIRDRETPVDVSSIRSITFEKEPTALRSLREAIRDGQVDQALDSVARINPDDLDRDIVKQEFEFLSAKLKTLQAKEGAATPKAAKEAMTQFLQRNPTSWRTAAAIESLADLAMQLGEYGTSAKMYARLAKLSTGILKMQSSVRSADALRASGDTKNAMSMYRQVLGTSTSTPEENRQKQLALVGALSVAAASGQAEQAIGKLKQVIADNDASDVELFGRAYNALGDCYRATNKPTEAALAYLHTHLLFYREANVHAESLYWLGKLWPQLGKSQRGTEAKNLLRQRYPTSPWAQKN